MRARGVILLAGTGALVAGAAAGTAWPPATADDAFQRATGGVGLGPSVSVAQGFFTFDARAESACENELWPIPGLPCPNPGHGTRVADLPPLR